MSRTKKSRSGGNGDLVVIRQRSDSDQLGRTLKKMKKRKGLKTGSRHSEEGKKTGLLHREARDPRLGSKKKIPLVVEAPKKLSKKEKTHSAEQELEMLENDAQLLVLLDRIEAGDKLGAGLQQYVDQKLTRIEQLMKQLGLLDEEEEDEVVEAKTKSSSKPVADSDDDLLARFDNQSSEDF